MTSNISQWTQLMKVSKSKIQIKRSKIDHRHQLCIITSNKKNEKKENPNKKSKH